MKILLFLPLLLLSSLYSFSQVIMRDTVIQWQHFDYELNADYGLSSYSETDVVTTSFNGIVLENQYVKICLIPEFGGRIISYIYKPTGKEQLYQNPIGNPYQINSGIFYHDWLMVYGGIFPTFPDAEHGKYWNTPWKSEVFTESTDKITVSMSQKDTLNNPQHPAQYSGITGITCFYNVSLEANQPFFTVDVALENDDTGDNYEYWTCITFAPGSESGNTISPADSEMIVPIDQYKVGWNPGDWMLELDSVIQSNGEWILEYKNLAHLSNWEDMGIAYANPTLEEPYYGVINHENENGLFRISSDQSTTPGLKFWTWGNEQGLNADPNNFDNPARPYIELWSGISNEFFEKEYLEANQRIEWTETYFPTVGLPSIDYISKELAFNSILKEGVLTYNAFYPVNTNDYSLRIDIRQNDDSVFTSIQEVSANSMSPLQFGLDIGSFDLGNSMTEVEMQLLQNGEIIHSKMHYYQESVLGIKTVEQFEPRLSVKNNSIHIEFENKAPRQIAIYDINGQLIEGVHPFQDKISIPCTKGEVYIIRVVEQSRVWSKKIVLN